MAPRRARGLGFMVRGFVSRLSVADPSDSGSFLVAPSSLSQQGVQQRRFWELVGYRVSPSDFSQILPVGGWKNTNQPSYGYLLS